jgi:hypothetical protein
MGLFMSFLFERDFRIVDVSGGEWEGIVRALGGVGE